MNDAAGAAPPFLDSAQDRDVIHAFSGVRLLYDDNAENRSAVTRKYVLEIHGTPEVPPPVPIVGCKITTSRRLAEHTPRRLVPLVFDDVTGGDERCN